VTTWRKSSHSGTEHNACVEVASLARVVGVRDSKDPEGGALLIARSGFRALLDALKRR